MKRPRHKTFHKDESLDLESTEKLMEQPLSHEDGETRGVPDGEEMPLLSTAEKYQFFLVCYVSELAKAKGLSQSELGRRVFGSAGARVWRTAREAKRRRNITVADLFHIATALDTDLPGLMWKVDQAAKNTDLDTFFAEEWWKRQEDE